MSTIRLLVGLANPGPQYERTRHNAGAWFIETLARACNTSLRPDSKYHGLTARIRIGGEDVHLLIPTTFMNRSGQSVAALANFYKIPPEQILVAHDELDMPPGVARLKLGGGHGGHNGLRDIISRLGNNKNFHRLRIGIGHPGDKSLVSGYVLGRAPQAEQQQIEQAVDEAMRVSEQVVRGEMTQAMNRLHSFRA